MKLTPACRVAVMTSAALLAAAVQPVSAQEFDKTPAEPAAGAEDSWYQSPAPRAQQPSIAREKAIARGQQRMARLEAMRWYGFSNSRPTAAAMPFTSMYSPAWQQPGGRPFAWYTSSRPIVIYTGSSIYK